jgi:hypothetical protein
MPRQGLDSRVHGTNRAVIGTLAAALLGLVCAVVAAPAVAAADGSLRRLSGGNGCLSAPP